MWAMGQTLPIRALQSVSAGAAGFAADAYENAPEWIASKPNYQLDGGVSLLDGIGEQIAAAREDDDAR